MAKIRDESIKIDGISRICGIYYTSIHGFEIRGDFPDDMDFEKSGYSTESGLIQALRIGIDEWQDKHKDIKKVILIKISAGMRTVGHPCDDGRGWTVSNSFKKLDTLHFGADNGLAMDFMVAQKEREKQGPRYREIHEDGTMDRFTRYYSEQEYYEIEYTEDRVMFLKSIHEAFRKTACKIQELFDDTERLLSVMDSGNKFLAIEKWNQ